MNTTIAVPAAHTQAGPTRKHDEVSFETVQSSPHGIVLAPAPLRLLPTDVPLSSIVEDSRVFDRLRYAEEVHAPVPLFSTGTTLYTGLARCLDMPIRIAGDTTYHLPNDWTTLAPVIAKILAVEHEVNPSWRDYHTYITVDCSRVTRAAQQRNGGLHVDGFQGARIHAKTKVTRNYVATTNGGTRFYPYRFRADLDDRRFNIFEGWNLQAEQHGLVAMTAPENTVCFMDAYTVHESGLASRSGMRTFLRVTYDLKPFDRLGNTRNLMLDSHPGYQWDMVTRTVHETLQTPTWEDIEQARDARPA